MQYDLMSDDELLDTLEDLDGVWDIRNSALGIECSVCKPADGNSIVFRGGTVDKYERIVYFDETFSDPIYTRVSMVGVIEE